ncbi:MAG: hypothetical protein CMM55_17010 [Rhodospirillaceae bacterium]|nr:hypothetical protein [Rhodospirillaceae bacterium]
MLQAVPQRTRNSAEVQHAPLAGGRLHLNEGPIDLVIGAKGQMNAVRAAYTAAAKRFDGLLDELVAELPLLRQPLGLDDTSLTGPISLRMERAVRRHSAVFVTPMAAVAGAVADETLAAMSALPGLDKAYVNNGGDIAFHLAPTEHFKIGTVSNVKAAIPNGFIAIPADTEIRGVATSGADGRSFSMGIADAVTVLAQNAAAADVAATLIANAVNTDHPSIHREPAQSLDPDNDLCDRLVTVSVGKLPVELVAQALEAGAACAESMRRRGSIRGALLRCQGQVRIVADDNILRAR